MCNVILTRKMGTNCSCSAFDSHSVANTHRREKTTSPLNRGFATAHLLASEIRNYLSSPENRCEFLSHDEDDIQVLEHIIVFGGAVRDILLKKESIKDLDINISITKTSNM